MDLTLNQSIDLSEWSTEINGLQIYNVCSVKPLFVEFEDC